MGDAVIGRVALVPLSAGEVVTAAKVAPTGLTGVSALLPPDARGLAIPTAPSSPPPVQYRKRRDAQDRSHRVGAPIEQFAASAGDLSAHG